MHQPLNGHSHRLPTSFPVGAKYVVEGRGGEDGALRVWSRYVVLPTGRRINVPAELAQAPSPRVVASPRSRGQSKVQPGQSPARTGSKKIIGRAGTTRQHGR